MTTEFELIRRYRGAFTSEECDKLIDYIDNFDDIWVCNRIDIAKHWFKTHPHPLQPETSKLFC